MITHEKFNNAIIRRYPLLCDVGNICVIGWDGEYSSDIDDVIESLGSLVDNIKIYYPDLYNHMFGGGVSFIDPLMDFVKKNNFKDIATFNSVWKYIYENEDKHDWWML